MKALYRNSILIGLSVAMLASVPVQGETNSEDLKMTIGRSIVLDYPADIRQISTSDPAVVDPVAVTTREILLHGKSHGTATLVVWSKTGQRTFYNVSVEPNLEPIRRLLKESFPNEDIRVQAARDSVVIVGRVSSKEVSDRAALIAASLTKSVANNLQIAPGPVEKQVVLRVKFAQVDRNVGRQFALNVVSTGAGNTIGRTTTGQFPGPAPTAIGSTGSTQSAFTISDALNVFMFRPDLNLATFIKALQNQDVLQILAEPNLVTTDGKEASFLVGGEFPIPVLQGSGSAGAVTIQFREFGIRLTFTPQLTGNNTIKMHVRPEVSTIDIANGVSVSGFTIPALATRRIETNVELGVGQSFAIGGLMDDRVTESLQRIPGLANIPLLGTLFKSKSERKQKSELVIIVTPEIAEPVAGPALAQIPEMPKEFIQTMKFDKNRKPSIPSTGAQKPPAKND